MQFNPYLNFNGDCRDAFTYYQQVLGGEIEAMITHEDMSVEESAAPEWADKILHARLVVGDQILMGSDAPPEYYGAPQGMYVLLAVETPSEAERIFAALIENGSVEMTLQETPWAVRFAMLKDRFGIPWMINCDQPV